MTGKRYSWVLIFATEIAISLPYLLSRPTFVREDWTFVGRTKALGAWNAADPDTTQLRPVVRAIYAPLYALATEHAFAAHLLLICLAGLAAVLLYFLAKQYLSPDRAFAVALLWVLLPTHLTIDHWIAATNITISAILIFSGLILLKSAAKWTYMLASALLSLAVMCYEPSILVVLSAPIMLLLTKRPMVKANVKATTTAAALTLSLPLITFVLVSTLASEKRSFVYASPIKGTLENLGIFRETPTVAVVVTFALVTLAVYLLTKAFIIQKRPTSDHWMIAFGAVIFLGGIAPFVTAGYDAVFVGVGDRANYLASVGVAMIIVGIAFALGSKKIAYVMVAMAAVAFVPSHLSRSNTWTDEQHTVVKAGDSLIASVSGNTVVLRPINGFNPGKEIGLDSGDELRMYLESGWRARPLQVVVVSNPDAVDTSELLKDSSKIE